MCLFSEGAHAPSVGQSSPCCFPLARSVLPSEPPGNAGTDSCVVLLVAWRIGRRRSYGMVTAHDTDPGRALSADLGATD